MHPRTLTAAVALAMNLAIATTPAWAQVGQPGRLLASNCFQCHGTNGNGPGFDRLAGKSASEIYKELKEFQSGKEGNGIMAKHAMAYSDEQLKSLSAWFAAQKPTTTSSNDD
jgi:cytochrome subunit of sulfide dehydrogenase